MYSIRRTLLSEHLLTLCLIVSILIPLTSTKAKAAQNPTNISADISGVMFSGAIEPVFAAGSQDQASRSSSKEPVKLGSGFPEGVIEVAESLPNLLWVDLEQGSLHVLKQTKSGWFEEQSVIPISIGKKGFDKLLEGDLKTPVGVYHVTSYLNDNKVADKYGNGAFPINYPNIYDRLRKRTGSGIWLHGLPKGVAQRPKLDSDGCVVIDNVRFDLLRPEITPGETLMVLGSKLQWQQERGSDAGVLDAISAWHSDWQEVDTPAYLAHYDEAFTDSRRNLTEWKRYKTRVNKAKQWIKVGMEKLSVLSYPLEDDLVAMRFYQVYKSNNYQWRGWKHLLWRKGSDNRWRIIYEGNG